MCNKKFGRVLVLEEVGYNSLRHDTEWKCQCDCGTIFITGGNGLRSGKCTSCGCYCKERIRETHKINMIGAKFGKLTVLEEAEKQGRKIRYKCRCECGNITTVIGEDLISQLLRNNNILFETEKTFDNCRFPDTNYHARFDFWVNNSYLIEFDGVQHFNIPNKWDSKENYEIRKRRDDFKTEWCKKNNIPLIRIPYTQLSYLTLQDLLLESSNFKEM